MSFFVRCLLIFILLKYELASMGQRVVNGLAKLLKLEQGDIAVSMSKAWCCTFGFLISLNRGLKDLSYQYTILYFIGYTVSPFKYLRINPSNTRWEERCASSSLRSGVIPRCEVKYAYLKFVPCGGAFVCPSLDKVHFTECVHIGNIDLES